MMNKIKDFKMAGSNLVQSVLRGTEIVEVVARSEEGLTLNEISLQVKLKATTVYNILRTFCVSGWLEKDSDGKYFIGSGLLSAVRAGNGSAVLAQAIPVMLELNEQFPNGTLTFSEFAADGIWCRLRMSPDRQGMIQRRVLQHFPPYTSATGIVFQAFMSEEEFSPVAELYPFHDYNLQQWDNEKDFEDHLAEVRAAGYALRPGAITKNLAIAFPVQGEEPEHHELRYVLGISFNKQDEVNKPEVLVRMREAVKSLAKFV